MNTEMLLNLMKQNGAEIDPKFEMFAQMMSGNNSSAESTTAVEEGKPNMNKLKYIKRIKSLKHENQLLKNGIEQTLNVIDELARLLGACSNCFGNDMECEICHGQGKPGYFSYDKKALIEFIKPCLEDISKDVKINEL